MAFYVESSAAAKLVLDEPESDSLEAWMLATAATFISSDLTRTELIRATHAIHLAAALELGDELDGIVTYDDRLADAATQLGIPVVAPA